MATITISKDKINGIGSFFDGLINSSNDLNAQFDSLKSTLAGVKSSTCDLSGTIETIRSSTATEEEKIEDVKKLKNKIEDFIDMAVDRDQKVADLINEKKEEFYSQYEYLKPECEKSTFEKFCDDMESAAEWCKEHWKFIVTVVVVAIAVVVLVAFAPVSAFLAGLCWGAINGAVIGGVAGGIISMLSGGSFFEGFEEGAFSGMINGIICGGLGSLGAMAGESLNAFYEGAACLSKAGQALSKTAKVLNFLDNGMDAFDALALIDGLDGGGVIADLNNTLHGSTAYNIFQSGVSYASVFTGGAAGEITCFVAGTLVATKDGLVPIESLKEGDLILSKDVITGEIGFKPVISTFSRKTGELVHLTFEDEEIVASLNHPFFVDGHGFVPAGDLWIGANCVNNKCELLTLSNIYREDVKVNPVEVFNIKVDDYHTYFVSELGLWVHNTDCAKIIQDVESGDIKLESTKQKGNYGEMKMDAEVEKIPVLDSNGNVLEGEKYTRIGNNSVKSLDDPGHQGIDGIYKNDKGHPKYIIGEAKYNKSQLSKGLKRDGTNQMDNDWIINRLEGYGCDDETVMEISDLLYSNSPDVVTKVFRTKPGGEVIQKELLDGKYV